MTAIASHLGAAEGLKLEAELGVATITIEREDDQNRLTPGALQQLRRITAALAEEAGIQAVIVVGAGRTFSTGLLNPVLRASMGKDEVVGLVRLANVVFDAIDALPQIVIAAINARFGPGRSSSRSPATSAWLPPRQRSRCRKLCGAGSRARAPRSACLCWSDGPAHSN